MVKKLLKNKIILVALFLVTAGLVSVAAYVKYSQPKTKDTSPNVTKNRPAPTNTPTESSATTTTPATAPVALPKPLLAKSSGNNGSVPPGIPIEFTCKGQLSLQCTVILIDKNNPANKIDLGAKTIQDDGYGQAIVAWNWNSVSGNWSVIARVTDGKGNSAQSDEQSLVVQ